MTSVTIFECNHKFIFHISQLCIDVPQYHKELLTWSLLGVQQSQYIQVCVLLKLRWKMLMSKLLLCIRGSVMRERGLGWLAHCRTWGHDPLRYSLMIAPGTVTNCQLVAFNRLITKIESSKRSYNLLLLHCRRNKINILKNFAKGYIGWNPP